MNQKILTPLILWAIVYYLAGEISQNLNLFYANLYSVAWFPAGVAILALRRLPLQQWFYYFLVFFLLNQLIDYRYNLYEQFVFNILNVFIPFTITFIFIQFNKNKISSRVNHLLVGLISTILVCALGDGFVLFLLGLFNYQFTLKLFLYNWLAHISSIVYVVAMVSGFANYGEWHFKNDKQSIVILGLSILMLLLTGWIVFAEPFQNIELFIASYFGPSFYFLLAYIPLLFVVAISLVLNELGRGISLLLLSSIVIYYTKQGYGPFFIDGLHRFEPLIIAQCYLSSISVILLLITIIKPNKTRSLDEKNGIFVRYEVFIKENKVIFDHKILDITDLNIVNSIDDIMSKLNKKDSLKLQKHWSVFSDMNNKIISLNLKNETQTIKIKDHSLIHIKSKNQIVLVGEWFFKTEDILG